MFEFHRHSISLSRERILDPHWKISSFLESPNALYFLVLVLLMMIIMVVGLGKGFTAKYAVDCIFELIGCGFNLVKWRRGLGGNGRLIWWGWLCCG